MRQELEAARNFLEEKAAKQEKYFFRLYEADGLGADALAQRLGELKGETARLTGRVDELPLNLLASTATSVDYAQVRYLPSNLQRFLAKASPAQTKTPLQLLVMETSVREAVQRHIECGPTEQVSVGPLLSLSQPGRLEP